MEINNQFLKKYLKEISFFISGTLFSFGFEPFNSIFCFVISVIILYISSFNIFKKNIENSKKTLYKSIKNSFLFIFPYSFISFLWIYFAPLNFSNLYFFAPLALILVFLYLFLFFFIFLIFLYKIQDFIYKLKINYLYQKILSILLFSFLFVFCFEFLRSFGLYSFPWNMISSIFIDYNFFIKIIQYNGIFISDFIIIFIIAAQFELIYLFFLRIRFYKLYILLNIVSIFLLVFFGSFNIKIYNNIEINKNDSSDNKNQYIRIVSTNISQKNKWNNKFINENLIDIVKLSFDIERKNNDNLSKISYFIWPETSFTFFIDVDSNNKIIKNNRLEFISSFLEKNQYLIFGAIIRKENKNIYNSILIIDKDLNLLDFYHKKRLVPFGEFIPFFDFINKFIDLNKFSIFNSIKPSDKKKDFIEISEKKSPLSFYPLICFESIFPIKKKDIKYKNIDFILNITNDAWFDSFLFPFQSLRASRLRAIETLKPLIRSSNGGISAVIDQNGKIISSVNQDKNIIDFYFYKKE